MSFTLLLRFRDLSCPLDQTIERHKKIIKEEGCVWWGWWNKGHEKLPETTLAEFTKDLENTTIYLFDSGQGKFYSAKCQEVEQKLGVRIESPCEDKTPQYYKDNTHPIWFRFNEISSIDSDSIIGEMSYESMIDLFHNETHYEMFSNKVIASAEELTDQNRTMWKIRGKVDEDKTGEILLKDMNKFHPCHFDSQYRTTYRNSFLWLSDLHFTNSGFHEFAIEESGQNQMTLTEAIETAYFKKQSSHDIASLLISGDLTWKGTKEEFGLAENFINHFNSAYSLDKSWLCVCPGNHDLSFYSEGEDVIPQPEIIQKNCKTSKENYEQFYSGFFNLKPNNSMSSGRRFLVNGTIPVEIVMLNSVTLQQTKDSFQGHGFIGNEQLEQVVKDMRLNEKKSRNVTRICVMHHHLLPVSLSEDAYHNAKYSTVLDAERLSRWLTKYNFDFLLHGHMHQNFHCSIERHQITHKANNEVPNKLNVLSLGSSGVIVGHTGESTGNWTCKISFDADKIRFLYGKISPKDASLSDNYTLEFDYNG